MFDHSRKQILSIVDILKKVLEAFSIVLFVAFTIFYGYQIYAHLNSLPRIYIYVGLIIVHTISFILSKAEKVDKDATHAERYVQKKSIRLRRRIFKIIKMSINSCAIVWNFVEMIVCDVTDLNKMIVIVSGVFLIVQIILEVVLNLLVDYYDGLRIAFIEDIKELDQENSFKVKMAAKVLGVSKDLKRITDEDYFSDEEKEIARKQKEK